MSNKWLENYILIASTIGFLGLMFLLVPIDWNHAEPSKISLPFSQIFPEIMPDNIFAVQNVEGTELLRVASSGSIYIRQKYVATDPELAKVLKDFANMQTKP